MTTAGASGRVRTPERPGPGPLPPPLLRALELDVRRRIDGLLAGDFRSTLAGRGMELQTIRAYVPGDDVRDLEWNVTARTGLPHVRVNVAERALTAWLILDGSPSMSFGTADRRKADVAEGVALAVAHLATRRGNALGVMTFGGRNPLTVPPTRAKTGPLRALHLWLDGVALEGEGGPGLADTLRRAAAVARARAAVFVVSDFIGPADWRTPLLHLAGRHHVVAVEIQDPRELELPDVGDIWMRDPESGRQVRLDTGDQLVRARFARAAAADREETARLIRSAGAAHVVLSTSGDWLRRLARFLSPRVSR